MGRPETPLASASTVVQEFAAALRHLRMAAGSPSYRVMGERVHFSHTALSKAASGHRLPTLDVTLAYVQACGGDKSEWRVRWANATRQLQDETPRQLDELVVVGARGRRKRRGTSTTAQEDVAEEDADAVVVQASAISGAVTLHAVDAQEALVRRWIARIILVVVVAVGSWLTVKFTAPAPEPSVKPFEIQDTSRKPVELRPGTRSVRTVLLHNPNDFDLVVTTFSATPDTPYGEDGKPVESCRSLLLVSTPSSIAIPAKGSAEAKIAVELAGTVPPECANVVFSFTYSGTGIKGEIVSGINTSQ